MKSNMKRTCGLIIINIDPLQLKVGVPMVGAGGIDTVFVRDHLPELESKGGKHYSGCIWITGYENFQVTDVGNY